MSSARVAADLWRWFWDKIDDIDSESIRLVKTKGHATDVEVQEGRSTAFERRGNDNADHFAGRGVEVALQQLPNLKDIQDYKEVRSWYMWLTLLCAHWPKDTDPKPEGRTLKALATRRGRKSALKEAGGEEEKHKEAAKRRHAEGSAEEATEHKEASKRRRAEGGTEEATEDKEAAKRRHAEGSIEEATEHKEAAERRRADDVAQRISDKGLHPSHCLMITGDLIWCNHCGSYGQERFKALRQSCKGSQHERSKASQLSHLRRGRHPLTGSFLCSVRTPASTPRSLAKDTDKKGKVVMRGPAAPSSASREVGNATSQGATKLLAVAISKPTYRTLGAAFGKLV